MLKTNVIFLFSIILFFSIFEYTASAEPYQVVKYKNQRGSVLILKFIKNSSHSGTVTGKFKTAVASKGCKATVVGKWRPIIGFYVGNSIAYSIAYPNCGASTIAITGNFDEKGNLHTLFILANQSKDVDRQNWNIRLIGHDDYRKI